jgi:hypothetical protein
MKANTDKSVCTKPKTFCTTKETTNRMKTTKKMGENLCQDSSDGN